MNKTQLTWLAISMSLALASCAHQSKVTPSSGHIDGQVSPQDQQSPSTIIGDIPKPVKSTTYLPPPTPKAKEQTYSVVVNEVPVKEILFALARESRLNIDIHPSIQGRVTLNAVDQTLPAILERLSKQVDLTYKVEGNVLNISPDQPVLRAYKVDYVNMSRDTKGFIGAAAEISSTGQAATTGAGGAANASTGSSSGAGNSSRTSVTSESNNRFWDNLEKNIKELLAETDKEVIIRRTGTAAQSSTTSNAQTASDGAPNSGQANIVNNDVSTLAQEREDARAEYKTLFAATVISNREAGVISVRATSKQHEKVQEFLDKILSSAKRQVLVEATIVEVRLNDTYQAGINWSRLGDGFIFSQRLGPQLFSNISPDSITGNGPGFVAGYTSSNFLAAIQLLRQFGDTKVLSSPKLMVLNNQTAVLKVVDNLVYFTVQAQQSQGSVGGGVLSTVTTTPNTVPVGIVMSVTPQINDTGVVNINVRPTISSLIRYVPDPNPNLVAINNQGIPEIQVREMESLLQVNSGNTAVLGGLMQDVIRRNSDNVPGLYKLPWIGKLFTGQDDTNTKTELVIFLRPTVISNASLESEELQSYKQYLPTQQLQQSIDESAY
ncbi:MAG: pilus (MSHA type) biogenesis protein MshL [Nitrosomonadales bacterium]|nr:pilus (MSHA type) biogenesis protein MshL [Nitrosomonadales bacterium]